MNARISCLLILALATLLSPVAFAAESQLAERILDNAGVRGGLIVHVGCGDGKLTAALHASQAYLVHGLDADPANVEKAREHIRSLGLYDADDIVNLVVSRNLGDVSMDEVMRVLCPNGVALIRSGDRLIRKIKPRPDDIGEWTHYLQDASNNAVAADTKVAAPRRLKWACGPLWTRDHEFNSSLCAMVSGGGRLFYVFDEGLPGVTDASLPEKWTLIARDAFNGTLLWKLPLADWGTHRWKKRALRSVPMTIPRRIVAQGDKLFVTLGYDSPISVLDAATGMVLTTYEETAGTEEIRCIEGILLFRKGKNFLAAIDTETGKKLWEVTGKIQPFSWAAQDGRVYYQDGAKVVCLRGS